MHHVKRKVCGRDGSAAMLAARRSAGVAPAVSLREHVTHTPLPSALRSTNKAAHSVLQKYFKNKKKR